MRMTGIYPATGAAVKSVGRSEAERSGEKGRRSRATVNQLTPAPGAVPGVWHVFVAAVVGRADRAGGARPARAAQDECAQDEQQPDHQQNGVDGGATVYHSPFS
jgi:hypothetical protein